MEKKKVVLALGHKALGTTLPEQMTAVKGAAKAVADLVEEGCQLAICHSNAPQVGMIHTALNEFGKVHQDYTFAPMSVCSAMSQGYIGYDLQNGIREELLNRGIYRTVSTILTQVTVDTYDEAFYTPTKVLGRYMNAQEANEERKKGNYVIEEAGKGVVLYMNQEGRGIGLFNKMKAYKLQEEGLDTVDANIHLGFLPDEREYGVGAQILHELGVHKMRLLTNNPVKRVGLEAYGLEIVENVPIEVPVTPYDEKYMRTKKERMGHTLHFNK